MSLKTEVAPSLARTSPKELAALAKHTAVEKMWHARSERFATAQDVAAAVAAQKLVHVSEDPNFARIQRLRNPKRRDTYPPYLLPQSKAALIAITGLWRVALREKADIPRAVLSVTSMTRSEETQVVLVEQGKLADPESVHCVGAAIDIDASGYYTHEDDGSYTPVVDPRRDRDGMQRVADFFHDPIGEAQDTPRQRYPYNRYVTETFLEVVGELHQAGYIRRLVEFEDTANECVHIVPNPEVEWPITIA